MFSILAAAVVGALGMSGIFILAILLNPRKVQIWVSWLYRGALLVTKRAEYAYIANNVAGNINDHLGREIVGTVSGLLATRVDVQWHNDADAILSESEGTIIVRLRPHQERVANILHAYAAVTPRLIAPTIRSRLKRTDSDAIDLHLCRRLAERLSKSALVVFRTELLDPAISRDADIQKVVDQFGAIENAGLFASVFLQELVKLANAYPVEGLAGIDDEARAFYQFLHNLAARQPGVDEELSFYGRWIRVNILLVAKAETRALGLVPYRRRVSRELSKGIESIYVLATDTNIEFAQEVANAFDADMRLVRLDSKSITIRRNGETHRALFVPFERNESYSFSELAGTESAMPGFEQGRHTVATVTDVTPAYAVVSVDGIQAYISAKEVGWAFTSDCRAMLNVGDQIEVEIIGQDPVSHELYVSRRRLLENPYLSIQPDGFVGTVLGMRVQGLASPAAGGHFLYGTSDDGKLLPLRLYEGEYTWGGRIEDIRHVKPGVVVAVKIGAIVSEHGYAKCSAKRVLAESWTAIREAYPKGRKIEAIATHVGVSGVTCELEPGLVGFIPEDEFRHAGLEYSDFLSNVKPGQKLYVVVSRVVAGQRQRITLRLQANA